jgi:RNA polymerase sigma factor (sigma-70 family)
MSISIVSNRHEDFEILPGLRSPLSERRRKAENAFFSSYLYFVKEAAKKYGLAEEKLYDVYADSVIAAIESIREGRFQEKCSLKTFLYQIFRFKSVDLLRKCKTRKSTFHQMISIDEMQLHLFDPGRTVLDQLIQKSEKQAIKAQLGKLCDRSQRLLLLSVEGYSDEEIAIHMKFKTGKVVKTSRLRCIRKLRSLNDERITA